LTAPEAKSRERLVVLLHGLLRRRAAAGRDALLRTVLAMEDPRRAALFIGKVLAPLLPGAIVSLLQAVLDGADEKLPGAEIALAAMLSPDLRLSWSARLSNQVQVLARLEDKFDLAAMLLELPETDARFAPPKRKLPKDLEDVPLGRRKAMARRDDIYLMGKLLSDPSAAVIANLLDNPRLTTREVVSLAAQKEISGEFLELIALHPRWISQYPVKVALVHNPATPTKVALGFLRLLMSPDLKAVSLDGRLSGVVSRRAGEVLRRKRGAAGS